jgi:hypothetical protein
LNGGDTFLVIRQSEVTHLTFMKLLVDAAIYLLRLIRYNMLLSPYFVAVMGLKEVSFVYDVMRFIFLIRFTRNHLRFDSVFGFLPKKRSYLT